MRKIALSGIKGRKKDSFLMGFVVLLSLIFVITTTVLHTSSSATQTLERINTFGAWQIGAFELTPTEATSIEALSDVNALGTSRLLGPNDRLGVIGTYNDAFYKMGRLQMVEGAMPSKPNEVAIEYGLFMYFREDLKIGDRIPLSTAIELYEKNYWDSFYEQIERLRLSILPKIESKDYEPFSPIAKYIESYQANASNDQSLDALSEAVAIAFHKHLERNTLEHEMHDDIKVDFKETYLFVFIRDSDWLDKPLASADSSMHTIEEIVRDGTLMYQSVQLSKDMVLSGILETYTTYWDTDHYPSTTTFISEASGDLFFQAFYTNTLVDVSSAVFKSNLFIETDLRPMAFYERYNGEYATLKRNTFAFPDHQYGTDNVLMIGILGLIFLATIASVFQINLTQMRRRSRKLSLLKSLGTTNQQLSMLLLWEFFFLIALTVPLGILTGLLGTRLVIFLVNRFSEMSLIYTLDGKLLIASISLGLVSLMLGSSIPMIKAIRTPFNSTLSPPPKRKTKVLKHKNPKGPLKMQTFFRISMKHAGFERKKHLITGGLYSTAITVLIGTIVLSFFAFDPYVDAVVVTDKPAFAFEYLRGLSAREIQEYKENIMTIEGIERTSVVKYGLQSHLWHPLLPKHETFVDQRSKKDATLFPSIHEGNRHLMDDSVMSNVYGYAFDDPAVQNLLTQLPAGSINQKAFEQGDEVILLLPYYQDANVLLKNYDFRRTSNLSKNYPIHVLDEITFTTPTEDIGGGIDLTFHTVKVSGVIHAIHQKGIWPYSATLESPVVIGSYNLITTLYPASITRMRLPEAYLKQLVETLFPTRFGRTSVHIYPKKNVDLLELKMDLQRFGHQNDAKLIDLQLESDVIYGRGLKVATIIAMLGIAIATISLLILYNTSLSKLEQERERIGILQAIGVTRAEFKRAYFISALSFGLAALIIAHIINGAIVFVPAREASLLGMKTRLWLYPWPLHGVACLVFLILAVLSYYLPILKILNNQPVHNIQSLQD